MDGSGYASISNCLGSISFFAMHSLKRVDFLSYYPQETAQVLPCVCKAFNDLLNSDECWNLIASKNHIKQLTLQTPYESENAKVSYLNRCQEVYRMVICMCQGKWNIKLCDPVDKYNPVNFESLKLQLPKNFKDLKYQLFAQYVCGQGHKINEFIKDPVASCHMINTWISKFAATNLKVEQAANSESSALQKVFSNFKALEGVQSLPLKLPHVENDNFEKFEDHFRKSVGEEAFKLGGTFWGKKNYDKCFHFVKIAVDCNHLLALCQLGLCYDAGHGVAEDQSKAVQLFSLAANRNSNEGQFLLGYSIYYGLGIKKDYEKAVYYFELSANKGDDRARYHLGLCYLNGHGVPQDKAKAIEYLALAAPKIAQAKTLLLSLKDTVEDNK